MNIGIIGSGRIGSTVGTLWAQAGHSVLFSSRHPEDLGEVVAKAGENARAGTLAEAADFGEVVLFTVPWAAIDEAIKEAGGLNGKIVIDTTNQFGPGGALSLPGGVSALEYNAQRLPNSKLVKAYNTLTAAFQAESAGRDGAARIAMPYTGTDIEAKQVAAHLITDSGFDPFEVNIQYVKFIEPPRRAGAFYGEDWTRATAQELLKKIKAEN